MSKSRTFSPSIPKINLYPFSVSDLSPMTVAVSDATNMQATVTEITPGTTTDDSQAFVVSYDGKDSQTLTRGSSAMEVSIEKGIRVCWLGYSDLAPGTFIGDNQAFVISYDGKDLQTLTRGSSAMKVSVEKGIRVCWLGAQRLK